MDLQVWGSTNEVWVTIADQAMEQYETLGGISALPFTYLMDRDGKVVEACYGNDPTRTERR